MHKECVMVPSTTIHTLTPVTLKKKKKPLQLKKERKKNVKVVQRVDLIRLKR